MLLKLPILPPCRIMMKHSKSAIMKLNKGLKFWFLNGKGGCLGEILHLPTWQGSHPLSTYLSSLILLPGTWPKWRREENHVWNHVFNVSQPFKLYGDSSQAMTRPVLCCTGHIPLSPPSAHASLGPWQRVPLVADLLAGWKLCILEQTTSFS